MASPTLPSMDAAEAMAPRQQESINTEALFDTSLTDIVPLDTLNFDTDIDPSFDHAIESFGFAPSSQNLFADQNGVQAFDLWHVMDTSTWLTGASVPSFGVDDGFSHPASIAFESDPALEVPGLGLPYSFGAANGATPSVENSDSWAAAGFAQPRILIPYELQPAGIAGHVFGPPNTAASSWTGAGIEPTNPFLTRRVVDDLQIVIEPNPAASTKSRRVTTDRQPPKQRKRGRPRLFQVEGAEDSDEDKALTHSTTSSPSTVASPPLLRQTSGSSAGPSPRGNGHDDDMTRERRRRASIRYRRKLDTVSADIVEKAWEAEKRHKTLLACRDDLLDQMYDLKNRLLCLSQTRGDSPAIQVYLQAEMQRVHKSWGKGLEGTNTGG